MVAYIYQKLVEEGVRAGQVPARTVSARNWFRSLAEQTAGSSPSQIVNTAPKVQLTRIPQVGFMYNFFYDPKMKKELPYYDRFPLIFPFKRGYERNRATEGGAFYGINLHYLPPHVRSRFVKINADQWDTALFLPTERFVKKSKNYVYRQSRGMIGAV